ncbi:apolipoprotein D [Anabrus simplex]|uniref:apolipoprotein D n=1 Tax=Anabrus simplex TaxID=316456 RepID=UPI0034DDB644
MQSRTPAILVAFALVVVGTPITAQVPFQGSCPQMEVVQNFNAGAYLGKWYEQERYFTIFEVDADCVTATYTDEGNGVVGVNNENTNLKTNKKSSIQGEATLSGENGEAKLSVVFPSVGNFSSPYWVLETDYTRYSIVWSCSEILGQKVEFAWILTREKNPGQEVQDEIKEQLEKHSVPTKPFIKTKQVCEDN